MDELAGRVYAEALVGAVGTSGPAQAPDGLAQVLEDLELVLECASIEPRFHEFLASPRVPAADKKRVLQHVYAGKVQDVTLRFLMVLLDRGRQTALHAVVDALRETVDRIHKRQRVTVRGAFPMDEERDLSGLRKALSEATGRSVIFKTAVDPELLGGCVLRIGDLRVDGSLRRRLEQIGKRLRNTKLRSDECYEN